MVKPRFAALLIVVTACASPAKEDAKGQVDESGPPSSPMELGKADSSDRTVAVNVQSAHPYANNTNKTFSVPLTELPWCAHEARLHFKVLRTEANYDKVTIVPSGEELDGNHDDTWTEWFTLNGATSAKVKLVSDGSITRHGFEIDRVEWEGTPLSCPLVRFPPCGTGTVDLAREPGVCDCPAIPVCEPVDNIEVSHLTAMGRNRTAKTAHGAVATFTHPGPTDAPQTDTIGSIDTVKLGALVRRAAALGLLQGPGYERTVTPGATYDAFTITAGSYTVQFVAEAGTHDADVQLLVADFDALFTCGEAQSALTCGNNYTCEQSTCIEQQSCVCTANYDPVCGTNGTTYSNACAAGCASAPVAHTGECGITGDTCGTMRGLTCQDGYKCRFGASQFTYPFPDAGGSCVTATYCDAAADCTDLAHPAVPGAWACNANACAWQAGTAWKSAGLPFETAHPYGNNVSVWHQIYLPAGAQAMRLRASLFATEANYDKLEVWSWKSGAWTRVKSYSGTTGPALTDEFPGQFHYLKFVSDSSVTKQGVTVAPEYR